MGKGGEGLGFFIIDNPLVKPSKLMIVAKVNTRNNNDENQGSNQGPPQTFSGKGKWGPGRFLYSNSAFNLKEKGGRGRSL